MRSTCRFPGRRPVVWAGAFLLIVCALGCGQKESTETAKRAKPVPITAKSNAPPDPVLRREVAKFAGQSVELDPSKRPVPVSEKAETRFEWGYRSLLKGYREAGHANPKWDGYITNAFARYTQYRLGDNSVYEAMASAITNAVNAGCGDPMVQYMYARYSLAERFQSDQAYAIGCLRGHEGLQLSSYHPLYKFMAGRKACESTRNADPDSSRAARLHLTTLALEDLARDPNIPVDDAFDQAVLWVEYMKQKGWTGKATQHLLPLLQARWGGHERFFTWCGLLEVQQAWEDRGKDFADKVTAQGWQGFAQHLAKAEGYLTKAWQMNTNSYATAFLMMRVELGQGKGISVMRNWFDCAMALDPCSEEAARLMGFYLEPRWHGSSDQDSLEFARGCVQSTRYRGSVPLVLVNLHRSLASYHKKKEDPEYWHRSEVWNDVEASYEAFFKLNPGAYDYRHGYAWDAFLCGKYERFLAQASLFAGGTNFTFFGGKQKWDAMLAEASSKVR